MWEEMVTENVHSIIGICWNLKRRKGRCSTSNSWGDLYQRKKANINHEATHFTETNLSYSWGILYQLKIVSNDEKISGKKHPVIHKVTYFRKGVRLLTLPKHQELWEALTWLVEVSTISNIARTVAITTSLHLYK